MKNICYFDTGSRRGYIRVKDRGVQEDPKPIPASLKGIRGNARKAFEKFRAEGCTHYAVGWYQGTGYHYSNQYCWARYYGYIDANRKDISIDGGKQIISARQAIDMCNTSWQPLTWDMLVDAMDPHTRELVAEELNPPCSELDFLTRYLDLAPFNLVINWRDHIAEDE